MPTWTPKPSLSLAYHSVAACLIASDTGLSDDVGLWKLQRLGGNDSQWSDRFVLAPTDLTLTPPLTLTWHQNCANLLSDNKGVLLLVESSAKYEFLGTMYTFFNKERLYRVISLDGTFDEGGLVLTDDTEQSHGASSGRVVHNQQQPFGIISNNRIVTVSSAPLVYDYTFIPGDGYALDMNPHPGYGLKFNVMSQGRPYAEALDEVAVYDGVVPTSPTLARHPVTWRLYAAAGSYTSGNGVLLYTSKDQGLSWQHANRIVGGVAFPTMKTDYPYLWCDEQFLWMVVYREVAGQADGAQGEVVLYQFQPSPVDPENPLFDDEVEFELAQTGDVLENGDYTFNCGVTIGPCDEGRCAIIRDPITKVLTVLAPKTTEWADTTLATPGIVEYRSTNSGMSWKKYDDHQV